MTLALMWSRKRFGKKVGLTHKRFEGPERRADYVILLLVFLSLPCPTSCEIL